MTIRFRILGAFEAENDAGPLEVRGAKRRALLIRLLISPNQSVSGDRLAFDLWSGSPPAGAASTLASHMSLLRKALGPDRIDHQAGGYRLLVRDHELDASEFEADLLDGQRSLRQGDPQRATEQLQRGLGRWRGAALADVDGAPWAHGEIARLEELRCGAEETLLDARLGLGQHREIIAMAEAAVEERPLREQRWATYMLALYRSGRQADALRAFQRLRGLLAEELGVEPTPEVADLEEAIILQSADLQWSLPIAGPDRSSDSQPATTTFATLLVARSFALPLSSSSQRSTLAEGGSHALYARLGEVVVRHGGCLDRSAPVGVVATFERPVDALEAALSMQQESATRRHDAPADSALRIGIAIGEATLTDGVPSGSVVNEASTLCTVADPGGILVDKEVRAAVGRGRQFRFSELGGRSRLDGPGPAGVLTLDGSMSAGGSSPVPPAEVLDSSRVTFVGRAAERQLLMRLFSKVTHGQRELALIGGEPGIGKTSLTAEIARHVDSVGGTVLYGRCLEMASAPYQPFVEALGHFVHHAPTEELVAHVTQFGGELCRLVPTLSWRIPNAAPRSTADSDTERYLAFSAVVGLMAAASANRPVLLVLEDLHWADSATLQLLRHLIGHSKTMPLLVLGTFRSSEITKDHPLTDTFAALWREANVSRIQLDGLPRVDVQALCELLATGVIEHDAVSSFAEDVFLETDGNPFFVCELIRYIEESGDLVRSDGESWTTIHGLRELPTSLREVIGQRVHRLGAKTERILMLAAVIGIEFDLSTLAHVADMDPEPLLDLLEIAERSALIEHREDETFVFTHALICRALYWTAQPVRRRQLHARVARTLEVGYLHPTTPAVIARHFLRAGEQTSALRWAERAGYAAVEAMAPSDAARWFGQASILLGESCPEEQLRLCDLTTQHGIALRLAGDPSYRDALLRATIIAKSAGDGRRMAVAALANTRGYASSVGGIDGERLDSLWDSLELLGAADSGLRARLFATICSESLFAASLDDRRSLGRQAKKEAMALGDPLTIVEVNNLVAVALRYPTELGERLEDTETTLELAEDLHDPTALYWAIAFRMIILAEAGRIGEAEQQYERMTVLADQLGVPIIRWMTAYARAQWAFLHGETTSGERLAEKALSIGQDMGQPDALNSHIMILAHARWQQGRLDEMVSFLEAAAGAESGIPSCQGALARALCQAGRIPEALKLLDDAAANRFSDLPEDLFWSFGLVTFAEVAIRLERANSAAVLYELLVPFGDHVCFIGTTCEGPIAHYLGGLATVLGNYEVAERHFRSAAQFADDARSPYFKARCLIESGQAAAKSGELDVARQRLEEGRALAEQWQFAAEDRRADELLAHWT